MNLLYWLPLFGFVSLLATAGVFINLTVLEENNDYLCSSFDNHLAPIPHPFLCGKKIHIKQARVSELELVHGISRKRARQIVAFLQENPVANLSDLIEIKGIGQKSIANLGEYFF